MDWSRPKQLSAANTAAAELCRERLTVVSLSQKRIIPEGVRFPHTSGWREPGRCRMERAASYRAGVASGLVRRLAQRFNVLARGPEVERCLLAASLEIQPSVWRSWNPCGEDREEPAGT